MHCTNFLPYAWQNKLATLIHFCKCFNTLVSFVRVWLVVTNFNIFSIGCPSGLCCVIHHSRRLKPCSGIVETLTPVVPLPKLCKKNSHHYWGLLKCFRSTWAFFNNSAIILKLIWPEQIVCYISKISLSFLKTNITSRRNGHGRHNKDNKMAKKCRNSNRSPPWRSVEDQNRILLEACSSTRNRSSLRHGNMLFSNVFV